MHSTGKRENSNPYITWNKNNTNHNPTYRLSRDHQLSSTNNHVMHQQQTNERRLTSEFVIMCAKDYCDNTSLHGFKYITENDNFKTERVLWILFCICATIGTCLYLQPIFSKYLDTPMATTIDSVGEPIWKVPFPGVTICNVNKAMKSLVDRIPNTERWKKYPAAVLRSLIKYLAKIGHVQANRASLDVPLEDFEALIEEEIKVGGLHELMQGVMQPLDRMVLKCWWISQLVNCSKFFEIKHTDTGFCWGFNSVSMKLVGDKRHDDFQPVRVSGAGPNIGLTVLLNPEVEEYFSFSNNIKGFRVRIHHPMNFPNVATKSFLLEAGKEVYVAVTPITTKSTVNVRNTPMSKRRCRFEDEKELSYFPSYSYMNCRLECVVDSMRDTCGCVPYMYSNLKNHKLCNYTGIQCINNHTTKFLTVAPDSDVNGLDKMKSMEKCHCPSSCTAVIYNDQMSQASFPEFPEQLTVIDDNINKRNLVLLRVFFKSETFVQYQRDVMYTVNDLIASFGGIAGLFIGFSFVSIGELIYFFTVRPFLRWKRRSREINNVRPIRPVYPTIMP